MITVNWDAFADKSGDSVTTHFEKLCRELMWKHYAQYGEFRSYANQAGVEFHLKLDGECSLGEAGQWYGWQCKWYKGGKIKTAQRRDIRESLEKTLKYIPGITDWVLCTRFQLPPEDQKWFYGLMEEIKLTHNKEIKLILWPKEEIEAHLHGPGEIYRRTFFDDLFFTPDELEKQFNITIDPIKFERQRKVHQICDPEREILIILSGEKERQYFRALVESIKQQYDYMCANDNYILTLDEFSHMWSMCISHVESVIEGVNEFITQLNAGNFSALPQITRPSHFSWNEWIKLLRKLRISNRKPAITLTNLLADLSELDSRIDEVLHSLNTKVIALVGLPGCGKSELSIQLTAPSSDRPAGIWLDGSQLLPCSSLDALSAQISISGAPFQSFDLLATAVNAAGLRTGRRLPIVIDGLNESQDHRNWRNILQQADKRLKTYPYVVLICTTRPQFVEEIIPGEIKRIEMDGFGKDFDGAVDKYFNYYNIHIDDKRPSSNLFNNPLYLRLLCEVLNPNREKPCPFKPTEYDSTILFDKLLQQKIKKVAQLSPSRYQYHEDEVEKAINAIGGYLWEKKCRVVNEDKLRGQIKDDGRVWNDCLVKYLYDETIIVRRLTQGEDYDVRFIYDRLAGYIIAKILIRKNGREGLKQWVTSNEAALLFSDDHALLHPLASDIVWALALLIPGHFPGEQLWKWLPKSQQDLSLLHCTELANKNVDQQTIDELSKRMQHPKFAHQLLDKIYHNITVLGSCLNAEFLDQALHQLPMKDRDIVWSEWLRYKLQDRLADARDAHWEKQGVLDHQRDKLLARWLMWNLTSTSHLLRDYATKALFQYGICDPSALFDLTLKSLSINDPYVPERMLAASYGVTLSSWQAPDSSGLRKSLPSFAKGLVEQMFLPESSHQTRHVLMKDYALGIIIIAQEISPDCIAEDQKQYLSPPFEHLASPFFPSDKISDVDIEKAERAFLLDFHNYTIGRLVPDRSNYDDNHPKYQQIIRQIKFRIIELGYDPILFQAADNQSSEFSRMLANEDHKIDRYGKKYSWIAYFEMYGLLQDNGNFLDSWRGRERTSDADIDPCFPPLAKKWQPELPDLFNQPPCDAVNWISKSPMPDYANTVQVDNVDNHNGPWVLLSGSVYQAATHDDRELWATLKAVLVDSKELDNYTAILYEVNGLPNASGLDGTEYHYSYSGEMVNAHILAKSLYWKYDCMLCDKRPFSLTVDQDEEKEILFEIPTQMYSWESYHSPLNKGSGIDFPTPSICEKLNLSGRYNELDLYDKQGKLATIYRRFSDKNRRIKTRLLYIHADLMKIYLKETNQKLIWIISGERQIHYRQKEEKLFMEIRSVCSIEECCFQYAVPWDDNPDQ